MFINPFWAGVGATIIVELLLLIGAALIKGVKPKR